ncbi:PilN domain-containing protein [Pseudoduganella lutea]|uniref:Fimbrial assembly protein n=1 Tax=Pseudoduganella lutea TaxID=321985 RepID=A0A4P6L1P0_9BURK|nr:PilN domain-containing protein [Pseudoduganella lutea]QBE65456.1 hypothetical protein EWM63_22725 [Pseudoduganella lutea]
MADIDMIPRSWRDGIRVRHALRRTAVALAIVVLAGAAGSGWLRWQVAALDRQAAQLRATATQAQAGQAREAALREEHERHARQDALLRTLRRQGELAAFAQAIDGALPPDAWLTGIVLRRDLQAVGGTAIGSGSAQPAAAPSAAPAVPVPPGSTVELAGQALDYEAVTTFLARLGRAPGVATVQLQSSGAADAGEVGFHAVVTLKWEDLP